MAGFSIPLDCGRESTATIVLGLLHYSFRVSYQVHSQESAENRIKCQTETRPPVGYTGIVDEAAMDEIKNPVPNKGCDYEPEISFEAEHGNQQKAARNRAFNDQSATS